MSSAICHPSSSSLLLVGCGNMGKAMLEAMKKNTAHGIENFYVIDPNNSARDMFFENLSAFPENIAPEIILLAVKPQQLEEILPEYKKCFGATPLYISVAAGKTLGFFEKFLGSDAKIIRAMPNTPALVGKSITALCAGKNVSEQEKQSATLLCDSFGKSVWVEEKDMNAVTALSGSGPAYVFLFLEALTKAGIKAGLGEDIAKTLACEMLHGSIHLVAKSSESLEQLRKNVTSKGGTTEAALSVLMSQNGIGFLIDEAVQKAIKRAETLA